MKKNIAIAAIAGSIIALSPIASAPSAEAAPAARCSTDIYGYTGWGGVRHYVGRGWCSKVPGLKYRVKVVCKVFGWLDHPAKYGKWITTGKANTWSKVECRFPNTVGSVSFQFKKS